MYRIVGKDQKDTDRRVAISCQKQGITPANNEFKKRESAEKFLEMWPKYERVKYSIGQVPAAS